MAEQVQEQVQREQRAGPGGGPVGVVLAGGGARGAYEAGMLSVLLPALDDRGQRPTVFVGTSAGAINAVLFAALAHLPVREAAERALSVWRAVDKRAVFRPVLQTGPPMAPRYLAGLFNLPGQLTGLLDTSPLLNTLKTKLDWRQFHNNLSTGRVQAVAVATTACHTGRTEIFVEGPLAPSLPSSDNGRAVDYIHDILTPEHVLASAAIPVAFPPVRLGTGEDGGWYMDGGVRLNAPIKPAIALGVGRVVVLATDPAGRVTTPLDGRAGPPPAIQDAYAQVLHAAMVDRMVEDVRTLGKINELMTSGTQGVKSPAGREYRTVEYLFAGPDPVQLGELGELANNVLTMRFGGARALQHPDLMVLSRLLGPGPSRGELLSYLFFEPEFIDAAIKKGQQDAQRILDRSAGGEIWNSGELRP